jgi:hypothetical protein
MPQDQMSDREVGHTALVGEFSVRAGLGAVLATLLICANAGIALAADDGSTSFYDKFLQTIGVSRGSGTDIGYSERSPLVVPPTRDLPPPQPAVAPATPNWPKDPDLARREAAKAKDKVVPHPDSVVESYRVLRPDELNTPGFGKPSSAPGTQEASNPKPKRNLLDWFKKEEYATFTGEPARANLTDPPAGYLTPSPDQPYGVGPEKKQYKIPTIADRVEPSR